MSEKRKKECCDSFRHLYSPDNKNRSEEIEKLRNDRRILTGFFIDMLSNGCCYSNSDLNLINSNFDRIDELLANEEYEDAAIIITSLEAAMGVRILNDETLYYMIANEMNIKACLKQAI